MFAKLVVIAFILFAVTETNAKCQIGQDETFCQTVKCAPATSCPPGQHLVLYDPKNCICCDTCQIDTVKG
ncbi:hypothetical protein CBL_10142 [Carabus blaptoides fortunei]